jgi:hypothetical protein
VGATNLSTIGQSTGARQGTRHARALQSLRNLNRALRPSNVQSREVLA